jgi:hypothetical protein
MAEVKIPYYTVRRNGRGFWEPRPHMRGAGFSSVPCGPDGPAAWAIAEEWNRRWLAVRRGEASSPAMATAKNLSPEHSEELTIYPPRSLGEAFRRYRRTTEWRKKAPRTREDWWRVWRRMKPIFGDCDPRTVTLEDIDARRATVEEMVSLREAHRCIKIWRAMWGVSAALGYCVRDADPSLGITNRAAKGRSAVWNEGEVVRLYKRAWRERYYGLGAVIAVLWSTQQSPGDVRSLVTSQLVTDGAGAVFFTESRSAARSVAARWLPSRLTSSFSESSCTGTRRFSETAAARPIRAIRSATTSGTSGTWSSVPRKTGLSPTSAGPGLGRRSPGMPSPPTCRMLWVIPSPHRTCSSPPITL